VPHAIFFFACASIMAIELAASRLVARFLGSSLYTWTAVIGVMLAGITVGNVIGGRLADRYRPSRLASWLFGAAAAACGVALGLNALFAATRPFRPLDWPLQILLSVTAIFILPAVALGTLSPSLATMAVGRARRVGLTLGTFYAVGSAGSIAGTFLTGYWLLFAVGNTGVVVAAAACLALMGLACRLGAPDGDRRTFEFAQGRPARDRGAKGDPSTPLRVGPSTGEGRKVDPSTEARSAKADLSTVARSAKADLSTVARSAKADLSTVARSAKVDAILAWRYAPHAIVLVSSVCLMTLEILAGRVIAEQTGNSLYTWTAVIGIVLAGMSLGNVVGGVLSDRFDPASFLGWLFMAASFACVVAFVLARYFADAEPFPGWHWPAVVFTTVLCVYFVPSVLLGVFVPAATRMAVLRASAVGSTIGTVSAWNAAGSIVGTVAAGFWLIPSLGTRSLTMLVALALASSGVAFGRWRAVRVAWAVVAAAGLALTVVDVRAVARWVPAGFFRNSPTDKFNRESAYQHVRVYEEPAYDEPERRLRVVTLDYLVHGYVDVKDPKFLNYDYERVYRDVAERFTGGGRRVDALFLGGGSYTFPRWVLASWPGSDVTVAEIDPLVVEANYQATGLPRRTPIRSLVGDARNVVDDLPPGRRFDLVFGDAFNDLSVPYHLTTVEFTRMVAGRLKPGGVYLVNVIDDFDSGLLLGAFVNTLERVFGHVYVFCTQKSGVSDRRDTFVLAASNVELDTRGFEAGHATSFEGSLLTDANLAELSRKARGRVLTDDNAPVENLIAPVVRERTREER
jgi:predicted membrane-bound spermidine synthase